MKKTLAIIASFIGLVLTGRLALAQTYPSPAGYVNDFANIISSSVENQLETDLTEFDQSTSNEIAVVTLESLEDDVIENVAVELFAQWGIGKKNKDNGVLLLIAPNERELCIEVGYGLESVLTDSRAGTIIRTIITPEFKQDDYDTGIVNGVNAIKTAVTSDPTLYDQSETASVDSHEIGGVIYFGLIILIIYASAFLGRSKRFWPGGIIGALLGFFLATIILTGLFKILLTLLFALLGLFFDYVFSKNYKARKAKGLPTSWFRSGGGFFSGGSSGGGGFGGFGGGSSGGGGASGGW